MRGMHIGEEDIKPSLFVDDIILYLENSKKYIQTHTQREPINEFKSVRIY
jgi:hypothetical protein